MRGLAVGVTCLECGADVEPVVVGRIIAGQEVSAIVRCTENARHEWHVHVAMMPTRAVGAQGCGTNAGYMAHKRRGETPCDGCRQAHASYVAGRGAVV